MSNTKHVHVASEDNMDSCAQCGEDIRNTIHVTLEGETK